MYGSCFAYRTTPKQEGKNALLRMGLLGNPKDLGNRVRCWTPPPSIPAGAAAGCVEDPRCLSSGTGCRGRLQGYRDERQRRLHRQSGKAVGTVLADNQLTALLVGAVASNVKPDQSVVSAIAATQAADKLVEAMAKD